MNKHTATPWRTRNDIILGQNGFEGHTVGMVFDRASTNQVMAGYAKSISIEESAANAAYIVKAVNSHERYKAIAQSIIDESKDGLDRSAWRLSEALKLAECQESE